MLPEDGLDPTAQTHAYAVSRVLEGGGELGALMRAFDWSSNPLGPPGQWPQSLKTAIRILLTSSQPMFVWWGPELINLYNDAYRSIVGGKHPQALGQPASTVWREIWDQAGPRAEAAMRNNEGTYDEALLLIMERHGYKEETYYTFSYSPIPDDQGKPGGIICANTDDTLRVIGERRLRVLQALGAKAAMGASSVDAAYRAIAETLTSAKLDIPFACLYVSHGNDTAIKCSIATHQELEALDTHIVAEVLRSGQPQVIELRSQGIEIKAEAWDLPVEKGIVIPLSGGCAKSTLMAGISPLRPFDEDYRTFFDLVANQIEMTIANARSFEEERKRAEALIEIDRAKTAFFSNVSHEFRTPLTLILGPIEDVLNNADALPDAQREQLDIAHRNALRMQKLVNTLLDFSRIEAGRVQACYQPVDLAGFTAEMAGMFRSAIEKAGLQLKVDCPPLPERIYIDRDMWEKIVLNLLSNAFKHTFKGQIEVSLRWRTDHAELVVRDTGIGIPPEQLPQLFDRFHRVPNARSRTHEGTGIGLSLVNELVKLHGGSIEIDSLEDRGTTFTISMPTGKAHLPADRIEEASTIASIAPDGQAFVEEALRWLPAEANIFSAEQGDLPLTGAPDNIIWQGRDIDGNSRKARILLADDNADMRDYLYRLLTPYCDVEAVPDGQAALDAARSIPPDLILSDVMMPHMDGFELLETVRKDTALQTIPFVLLSARAGEESKVEGLRAGANDYLTKPFNTRELLARVKAHLDLHRVRSEAAERERKLRLQANRSEALFRAAFEDSAVAVLIIDLNGKFLRVNKTSSQLFGYNEAELAALSIHEVTHPDDLPRSLEMIERLIRGEISSFILEKRYIRKNKSILWAQSSVSLVRDEQGQPLNFVAVVEDMTENRRIKSILEGQKQALEQAVHNESLGKILETIVLTAEAQSDGHLFASILLMDQDGKHLRHGAGPSLPQEYNNAVNGLEIGSASGSCGTAIFTGKEVTVQDIENDPLWAKYKDFVRTFGLRACWSMPILSSRGNPLGTFALYYPTVRKPSANDLEVVKLLARTAGIVIEWHQNIQKRRQAEESLKESEARFRAMADQSPMMIYIVEPGIENNPHVSYFNKAWLDYTGQTFEESLGRAWNDIVHPDDMEFVLDSYMNAYRTQQPYRLELRLKRHDNQYRWFTAKGVPRYLPTGEFTGFIGTCFDIHERKQLAEALEQSEGHFRFVANRVPAMLWITDENNQCTYLNQTWLDFTGQTLEEGMGLGWLDKTHPDDRQRAEETFVETANKRELFAVDYRLQQADGTYRWVTDVGAPFFDAIGRFQGYIGYVVDITERKQAEEEQQKLAAIVENSRDFIGLASPEGVPIYVNSAGLKIIGRESYSDLTIIEYIYPEDRSLAEEVLLPELFSGGGFRHEIRFLNQKTGQPVWMLWTCFTIKDPETQKIIAFATNSSEIAEQKQAEESLKRSNEWFALVNQATQDAIWDWNLLTNEVHWNESVQTMFHYQPEEVEPNAQWWIAHIHPEDRERVTHGIHQIIDSGKVYWSDEYRYLCGNGDFRIVYDRGFVIHDEMDKPIRMIGSMQNITERKQAEVDLKESEERFRRLADESPAFIFLADENIDTSFLNKTWLNFTGLSFEEAKGRGWETVTHPDDYESTVKIYLDAVKARTPYTLEIRQKGTDGVYRWILWKGVPRYGSSGEFSGFMGLGIDIHDRKLAEKDLQRSLMREQQAKEEAEAANRKKSEFLALMSHELRTPLNAILGYSRMMEMGMAGPVTEKQTQYLGNVGDSGQHLLTIINDLLDVSKIEAGRMKIVPEWMEIEPIVAEIYSMMTELAERKHVRLSIRLDSDIGNIQADPARFRQILVNLVNNAIKFNRDGGTVDVELHKQEKWLFVSVQDTGIGIPKDKLPQLFSKFYQVDNSGARMHEGTGLGLALTKDLIELHGGEIFVESEEHKGSTFTFRIPIVQPTPSLSRSGGPIAQRGNHFIHRRH